MSTESQLGQHQSGIHIPTELQKETENKGINNRKFRPDIEGLRAIAVISVVVAHSGIGLKGGFVGVDIFFVISGYLITRHIFLEAMKTNTISLSRFYARRILRILPASMFVLLCTLLASFVWLSPLQLLSYGWDGLLAGFSGLNYRLAINGTDYFNTATIPTPFQHYWSLCVEEQFYFVWPVLMLILTKLFGKKSYFGSIISAFLVAVIAGSLYLSYTITASSQPWAYFGLHTRAWQMAIGSLLAININQFTNLPSKLASLLSWLGFGGLMYALFTFTELLPYPSLWALIPTVATAIVIASGVNRNPFSFESIFGKGIFQFIGKISYSWYLIHWPIFVVFLLAGNRMDISNQLAIILISFLLSIVSFYVIENPIRHNQSFKSSLKNTYILGISLILIVSSVCGGLIYFKTKSLESITSQPQKQVVVDKTEAEVVQKVKEGLELKTLPSNLVVPLEKVSTDKAGGCIYLEPEEKLDQKHNCTKGDLNSKKTIVLLGDSHANQYSDIFDKIAKENGYKLISYMKVSCPIYDIAQFSHKLKKDYTECSNWRKEVLDKVATINPDILIHTNLAYPEFDESKYTQFLERAKSMSNKVIELMDNAIPPIIVPDCIDKNKNDIQKCSFQKSVGYNNKNIRDKQIEIANKLGVSVVDPINWFCSDTKCPAVINNIIVYYDNSHITNSYAKYLGSVLESKLNLGK